MQIRKRQAGVWGWRVAVGAWAGALCFAGPREQAPQPSGSRGQVHAAHGFEAPAVPAGWAGGYETPIAVGAGDGAMGSKGFLKVGPHTGKWVGARRNVNFVAQEDTWLGFSARKPGGGRVEVQINDTKRKKNVTKSFWMPSDGSWGTFRLEVKFLGIDPGTPLTGAGFWLQRNDKRAPIAFDLDNVVFGTGTALEPPQPAPTPSAVLGKEGVRLAWAPPQSAAGIAAFRVYRGLHPAFARDARHLLLEAANPFCDDNAFAHNGDYFYAVRAVNFAGNEGTDTGAVRMRVE
ncbi:MAG: hypothetical protein JXR37_34230 [Kiritimatiellae bacterium]|nr:hypothetical protein [Kiritimatiellia bacterium]